MRRGSLLRLRLPFGYADCVLLESLVGDLGVDEVDMGELRGGGGGEAIVTEDARRVWVGLGLQSVVRIGVDDLGVGFNVHRIADLTPTSRTTASLVLPSAFRVGADGVRRLDTSVVTSARVTSTQPYTVSYEITPAAAWSDNAPIAAAVSKKARDPSREAGKVKVS